MKAKLAIVVLIVVSVLLGVALMHTNKEFEDKKKVDAQTIDQKAGEIIDLKGKLNEQQKVNTTLETNLTDVTSRALSLSNDLTRTTSDLERTTAELTKTSNSLKETEATAKQRAEAIKGLEDQIRKRDQEISELEVNRDALTKKMEGLNGDIKNLEGSIAETQRKLSASEGDRAFLLKELKRMQAEKAQLEKQMSDLNFLREQVKQLKEELSIKRRLDWIRRGLYGDPKKPGQVMQEGFKSSPPSTNNFNLDVEVHQDGTIKVKPRGTNAPPAAPK